MTKNGFCQVQKDDLIYFTVDSFQKTDAVRHCFTTRCGGISQNQFESLNLGLNRGDDPKKVLRNYEIICSEMGTHPDNVVCSAQTHSDVVVVVGQAERGNGLKTPNKFRDADAYVTNQKNVCLTIFMADCVPLLFFDPQKNVIAACHSGWRGTVQKISQNTIEVMEKQFGCERGDILCGVGPSIGPCCFEVDHPVVKEFKESFTFCDANSFIKQIGQEKYHIDLWKANQLLLLDAGLAPNHIWILEECTYCKPQLFYSHRFAGQDRGSLVAMIELK